MVWEGGEGNLTLYPIRRARSLNELDASRSAHGAKQIRRFSSNPNLRVGGSIPPQIARDSLELEYFVLKSLRSAVSGLLPHKSSSNLTGRLHQCTIGRLHIRLQKLLAAQQQIAVELFAELPRMKPRPLVRQKCSR